jgi:LysM domain-containing protein
MTASARIRLVAALAGLVLPAGLWAQNARPDTHTVNKGDTLWDLARTYMGDPLLWPEIYRLNTNVVEDPHWIYPGEILRLAPGADVSAVPATDTPPPAADSGLAAAPGDSAEAAPADSEALAEPQVMDLTPNAPDDRRDNVDLTPLVGSSRRNVNTGPSLEIQLRRKYRPVRRSEFYSSGFLTEEKELPLGEMLGTVAPLQIKAENRGTTAPLFSKVAVTPPAGAKYQVGDTLLVMRIGREVPGHGDVVVPTGLIRVTDASRAEVVGEVIAAYGQIHDGQRVMPAEKFDDPGTVRPVPISDGVKGRVVAHRDQQPLTGPQDVLFIDRGRADGVGLGDLFEIRATPHSRENAAGVIDEVMATVQVVHVGEKSSTARVLRVTQPDIVVGTEVRQIAKLPS